MKKIDLYPHNKVAYEKVKSYLLEHGKAAVIHPTGTGKSFIAFQLVSDHPDKSFLWIAPSEYIYSLQAKNLKEQQRIVFDNIEFHTYMWLSQNEEAMENLKPDYIILDEFHRAGAQGWGKGVSKLIEMYPKANMLGLSATNIRYLDHQRNMAEELFDGYVASEMSLCEAMAMNILPEPKYIVSVYAYEDELAKYNERIQNIKSEVKRAKTQEILEKLRRALEQAEKLDEMFGKYITEKNSKIIVFCSGVNHLYEMVSKSVEWFGKIDTSPQIYHVTTGNPESTEEFQGFLDDESEHLKLLYCIDMLNEGIHVEGLDAVILCRPTLSPIVYKQQIGRAIATGATKQPIIFDLVNNFDSLSNISLIKNELDTFKSTHSPNENKEKDRYGFEIVDELKDFRELINQIQNNIEPSWEQFYLRAKEYYLSNNNLLIPSDYVTTDGYNLGRWIRTQRLAKQNRDNKGKDKKLPGYRSITDIHIQMLDDIGMIWSPILREKWLYNYKLAREYYQENGNLIVPHDYIVTCTNNIGFDETVKLGVWITDQRSNYYRGRLSEEQINMLEMIGMSWNRFDDKWEKGFKCAKTYKEEFGDINFVPTDYTCDGFCLLRWLNIQRNRFKNGKLSEDRIKKLQEIDFKFSIHQAFWDKGYEHAKEYLKTHGNLNVPMGFECDDGFKLKSWLANQKVRSKKGTLSEEQIEMLNSL